MVQNTFPRESVSSIVNSISKLIVKQNLSEFKFLTHWIDNHKNSTYFLFESPNKNKVRLFLNLIFEVNQEIIEVSSHLTDFYINQSKENSSVTINNESNDSKLSIKVIVAYYHNNIPIFDNNEDSNIASYTLNDQFRIVKNIVKKNNGDFIEHQENSFVCFYPTVTNAIKCALEIRKFLLSLSKHDNINSQIKIGISVGPQILINKEFSNDIINKVKYLCCFSNQNQLVVSSRITVLFKNEGYVLNENIDGIKILSLLEEDFVTHMMSILNQKLNVHNYSINELAQDLGVSKSKLYRTLVSLTNLSPQEFIKEYKLIKALNLIEKKSKNLAEIAYETGFGSPSYFSKCFKKRYSIIPSEIYGKIEERSE